MALFVRWFLAFFCSICVFPSYSSSVTLAAVWSRVTEQPLLLGVTFGCFMSVLRIVRVLWFPLFILYILLCFFSFLLTSVVLLVHLIHSLFRALVSLLGPFGTLRLLTVSLDFESGCSFHFTQAVFRKIQQCSWANIYRRNERVRRICRKLMALNSLPHRFIPTVLRFLKTQVRGA